MTVLRRALPWGLILLALATGASAAPPPKPRPDTGIAVVFLRPLVPERSGDLNRIPVYRRPGIGPLGEMVAGSFPGLAPVLTAPSGTIPLAVLARKGEWLKIAYDDAGNEGWLAPPRSWPQRSWPDLLAGRTVRPQAGLRKWWYLLRAEPRPTAREVATVGRDVPLAVRAIDGDWLRVSGNGLDGWLRWRDEDGRGLVEIIGPVAP